MIFACPVVGVGLELPAKFYHEGERSRDESNEVKVYISMFYTKLNCEISNDTDVFSWFNLV